LFVNIGNTKEGRVKLIIGYLINKWSKLDIYSKGSDLHQPKKKSVNDGNNKTG